MTDIVNHPPHYTAHPSGVECIQVTEHMGFCLGNALKYIWRCDHKGNDVEDLRKAIWYLEREIAKREKTCYDQSGNPAGALFRKADDNGRNPTTVQDSHPGLCVQSNQTGIR